MSTITVRPSTSAAGSVDYVLYGRDPKHHSDLVERGETRAASFAMRMTEGSTPEDFVQRAERLAEAHGRRNQLYSYVLAFHPDEFDVTKQEDLDRVRDIAIELAERMHSADYLIGVHADAAGGHAHAHILVINHDNLTGKSLQRNTSWKHGLHQLNDELMRDEGLKVLPAPEEPKPEWELRREAFAPEGFEQVLGDKVYASLIDPRSVDRDAFEHVLAEHNVHLAVTNRDGWSYKMRREDNGKFGRKKASGLCNEFTAEGAREVFCYHQEKEKNNGNYRQFEGAGRYGTVGKGAGHAQRAGHLADEGYFGFDRPDQDDGKRKRRSPRSVGHRALGKRLPEGHLGEGDLGTAEGTQEGLPQSRFLGRGYEASKAAQRVDRDTRRAECLLIDPADQRGGSEPGPEFG